MRVFKISNLVYSVLDGRGTDWLCYLRMRSVAKTTGSCRNTECRKSRRWDSTAALVAEIIIILLINFLFDTALPNTFFYLIFKQLYEDGVIIPVL